mmetsp:Transcript_5742/g.8815  ORF Transcript_5742/g.8815 Transcript_5742/m.8815 type:complete len:220 (-) Transcript_5742:297-956(-)
MASRRSSFVLGSVELITTAIRSSRCSRTSPSSGLKVAINRGLQGWRMEIPSRSTTFTPSERTERRRFTIPSSSRLISSIYNTPRLASASRPGWNTGFPSFVDSSISTVPIKRSSVTPSGMVTNGEVRTLVGTALPASFSERPDSHVVISSGSAFANEPSTTSIGGRRACRPRARMDFAVPRLPAMVIPPRALSTAPRSNASLISSDPTTAAIGNALLRR